MTKDTKMVRRWGICCLTVLSGVLLIFHGFELVSVPLIKEHRESLYVLSGILMIAAGISGGVYLCRN